MKLYGYFLIIISCLSLSRLSSAAEFDCKTASLPSDFVICSSADLIAANSNLAKAWISSREDKNADEKQAILIDQKNWINWLNAQCGLPNKGKPTDETIKTSQGCVLNRIRAREEQLRHISATKPPTEGAAIQLEIAHLPVRIFATYEEYGDGEGVVFQIGNGAIPHLVHSIFSEVSWPEANKNLINQVRWLSPYLFVLSYTGGNCWDCEGVTIFKINGDKTIRLGDTNFHIAGSAPTKYEDYFVTMYSKFESTNGFCHACAPWFNVILKDLDDSLRVDGEATWAANQTRWQANDQKFRKGITLNKSPQGSEDYTTWHNDVLPALIANAALAKFCQKANELDKILRFSENYLDKDSKTILTDSLDLVIPLESPAIWNGMTPY